MLIADLHIHSRYSRATSREGDAPHLDLWARRKGIGLIGTGDFTHPAWRKELEECLVPAQDGLYRLKKELQLPAGVAGEGDDPRFVVSGEISCIYKKGDRVRKVHHVILLPGLEEAERLSQRLEAIGNIHSDGRPILGLDSRDLLEITLEACPDALFIPAHIWTPHFSLFGAFSGFDTIQECFEDLTPHIRALETGLSSDPPMNWRASMLDGYTLVSHSDAHSPQKLGREADLLDIEPSYANMKRAIETGEGFGGTIEFFPEEGKYHLDGHRPCHVCLTPEETMAYGGKCPVCGRKITIGVEHRVEQLADRPAGYRPPEARPFESLVPLQEVIASAAGISPSGQKAQAMALDMLRTLGPEFAILRELPLEEIEQKAGAGAAEGIRRLRRGEVERIPGYDGEYGRISLFRPEERDWLKGQISLFGGIATAPTRAKKAKAELREKVPAPDEAPEVTPSAALPLNEEQRRAVEAEESTVMVIAGPGTGKTATLTARIAWLVEKQKVRPQDIAAVTFTRQAAKEMRQRLEARLPARIARKITVGTFHAICLQRMGQGGVQPVLIKESDALEIAGQVLGKEGCRVSPRLFLQEVSRQKNGMPAGEEIPLDAFETYAARLKQSGVLDMDDLLLRELENSTVGPFPHLLVDEFQDINALQLRLVLKWSEGADSLFVIGDPDQSIYGFRGADAACFDRLSTARPNGRIIRLVRNYRSTPQIVRCALGAIAQGGGQERRLAAQAASGKAVRLLTADSDFSQAVFVAKEIARMTGGMDMLQAQKTTVGEDKVRSFSDMAVLCRTHHALELLEKCLRREDIPCIISGREDYLTAGDVRGVLGFFSWLCQPEDIPALHAALTLLFGCPADLRERAENFGRQTPGCSLDEWRAMGEGFAQLRLWLDMTEQFAPLLKTTTPRKLLEQLIARCRIPRTPAMERLLGAAVFHSRMPEFLQDLTFGEEADICRASQKRYTAGAVRLMTLHGAKGLEFPVVFLCGVNEGLLPYHSARRQADPQEERRLFYVGLTRAREELILLTSGAPSPFLQDLPPDSIQAGDVPSSGRPAAAYEQTSLFV